MTINKLFGQGLSSKFVLNWAEGRSVDGEQLLADKPHSVLEGIRSLVDVVSLSACVALLTWFIFSPPLKLFTLTPPDQGFRWLLSREQTIVMSILIVAGLAATLIGFLFSRWYDSRYETYLKTEAKFIQAFREYCESQLPPWSPRTFVPDFTCPLPHPNSRQIVSDTFRLCQEAAQAQIDACEQDVQECESKLTQAVNEGDFSRAYRHAVAWREAQKNFSHKYRIARRLRLVGRYARLEG